MGGRGEERRKVPLIGGGGGGGRKLVYFSFPAFPLLGRLGVRGTLSMWGGGKNIREGKEVAALSLGFPKRGATRTRAAEEGKKSLYIKQRMCGRLLLSLD